MVRTALLMLALVMFVSQSFAQVHGNRAHYAEYSPDGKHIAIAGDDLLLLNRSNEEVRVVNAYNPEATTVAFSQDGRYLAAESKNFTIYVYDLQNPDKYPVFFKGLKKRKGVQSRLKFNPDGTLLATSNSSKVVFYNLKEGMAGKIAYQISNDPSNTNRSAAAFDITPDWKTVFFNMQSISLTMEKGKFAHKYGKRLNWDRAVANQSVISPDGTKVAVTARNGLDHRIYDLKTGEALLKNTNPRTYALAANKDFTKIYMNQAVWDLETKKIGIIYQARGVDKNTKTKITVAPDNDDFMIGLYQYNKDARLKKLLQQNLTTFNRVEFSGNEVHFFKDYSNGRYDLHAANIDEGLRGRSNRNLNNRDRINTALATSDDGSFGINHLSRVIRKSPMTVSSPLFSLSSSALAADISKNNLVAIVNQRRVYLSILTAGINDLNKKKNFKPIVLPHTVNSASKVKVAVSNDNRFVAVSYLKDGLDKDYGEFDTLVYIYDVNGNLLKTEKTVDLNVLAFSNDSRRLYFNSGKKLTCYSVSKKDTKYVWEEDDTYTFYTESGSILAMTLSDDDTMIGYASSNGYNKVVKARFGNDVITCIMLDTDRLQVIKK